jgi:hypothetical protein
MNGHTGGMDARQREIEQGSQIRGLKLGADAAKEEAAATSIYPNELDYGPILITKLVYNVPYEELKVEGVGTVRFRTDFLNQVRKAGWGKTRANWFLGYKLENGIVRWLKSDTDPSTVVVPTPTPSIPIMGIIDVLNYSNVSDAEIKKYIEAVDIQCDRDVSMHWGVTIDLNFIDQKAGQKPVKNHWYCGFFNDSDEAGVLGWHTVGPNNEPLMKIFTNENARFGLTSSGAFSHEVVESIGDPDVSTIVKGIDPDQNNKTAWYFKENCDPVEAFYYKINGVDVSDFVTPQWFMLSPPPGAQFSHLKKVSKPWTIARGGYMEISYGGADGPWTQIFKSVADEEKTALRMAMADKRVNHHKSDDSRYAIYKKNIEEREKSTFEVV